jgi:hypothetical protein
MQNSVLMFYLGDAIAVWPGWETSSFKTWGILCLNSICHSTIYALTGAYYPITQLGYNAEHEPLLSLRKIKINSWYDLSERGVGSCKVLEKPEVYGCSWKCHSWQLTSLTSSWLPRVKNSQSHVIIRVNDNCAVMYWMLPSELTVLGFNHLYIHNWCACYIWIRYQIC